MRQSVEQALAEWVEYAQAMTRRLRGVLQELEG
jgi:phage tail tape-measure protein